MKKFNNLQPLCFTLLIAITISAFSVSHLNAQLVNVNPDPNGEPWIAGDLPELTAERMAAIEAIPQMTSTRNKSSLPSAVDNSKSNFMPYIFSQGQIGSCAQCAGVSYTFAYEINCMRNLNSKLTENEYPELFSYNFVNCGADY